MKVRNLIWGLTIALAGLLSLGEARAQKTFGKEAQIASVMLGLPSRSASIFSILIPPITGVYEYGIVGNLFESGNGSIGVGAQGEYALYRYNREFHYSYAFIGGRAALHYEFLPKLDTYLGLSLGWAMSGNSSSTEGHGPGFGSQFFFGGRYYFSPTFALGAELGYGITLLNVGATFRF